MPLNWYSDHTALSEFECEIDFYYVTVAEFSKGVSTTQVYKTGAAYGAAPASKTLNILTAYNSTDCYNLYGWITVMADQILYGYNPQLGHSYYCEQCLHIIQKNYF